MSFLNTLGRIGNSLLGGIPSAIGDAASAIFGNQLSQSATDKMNQYNSPAAQMQRYREAGLNPNLIYGQGTPGNQSSATPMQAPPIRPMDHVLKMQALSTAKQQQDLMMKQYGQVDANIEKTQAETRFIHSQTLNADMDHMYKTLMGAKLQAEEPYFESNAKYSNLFSRARARLTDYSGDAKARQVQEILANISLKQAQALSAQLDQTLKKDVHARNAYEQILRDKYHINPSGGGIISEASRAAIGTIQRFRDKNSDSSVPAWQRGFGRSLSTPIKRK